MKTTACSTSTLMLIVLTVLALARHTMASEQRAYSVPPDHFEQLKREAPGFYRPPNSNLDVVNTTNGETYGYCHMPYFFPFSFFPGDQRIPFPVHQRGSAAIHMAITHLNTGDGSVIEELQGLDERCPLRFTYELGDTEMWETTTVNQVVQITNRESTPTKPKPCAFLGAGRSAVTMPMSIITGVAGYPQMTGISTSSQLDDRSQYKYFSRLIPSDDGTAIPVILYLRDIIQTEHMAVIHDTNIYSTAFLNSLLVAKTQYAPKIQIQAIDIPFNDVTDEDLQTAVSILKGTECRYIFSIVDGPKIWDRLMTVAQEQEIAGDAYTWMHSDSLFEETIADRVFGKDSPLAEAARGTSMLTVQAGLKGAPVFDRFVEAFNELGHHSDHMEYLQSKMPYYPDEPEDFPYLQVETLFGTEDPGANAIFLYDATIAMGLAACEAASEDLELQGQTHYQHIINQTFVGASGDTKIDPQTGTRDPASALFQLINFVPSEVNDTHVQFEAVQSDLFQHGEWKSLRPYVYGDGTSNIPPSLPEVEVNENHITTGLRITGFLFSGLIMLLALGCASWTVYKRKLRVVCASQPIFLLFICGGVFLMGSAIIPLSIDDAIAGQRGCDIACMATPWLFSLGFAVTYAALFSKTWRINKLMNSRTMVRVRVTAMDVMAPFAALFFANALIMALWTGLAPLEWEREVSGVDKFGQITETQGGCYSENFLPFVIPLGIVNLGALVVAAIQAYQAREISLEFAESEWIGKAIFLFLLACFYGIPVLIIAWEQPSSRYFVLMALATVCSLSVLLMIFVPKIRYVERLESKKEAQPKKKMPRVAGGGSTYISGLDDSACYNSAAIGVSGANDHSDASLGSTQHQRNSSGATAARPTFERSGLSILDAPGMRQALKKENLDLKEEQALLRGRIRQLEMQGPSAKEMKILE